MAMEHFEEHVQPSLTTSTSASLSGSYFMTIHPSLFRPSTATPTTSPSSRFAPTFRGSAGIGARSAVGRIINLPSICVFVIFYRLFPLISFILSSLNNLRRKQALKLVKEAGLVNCLTDRAAFTNAKKTAVAENALSKRIHYTSTPIRCNSIRCTFRDFDSCEWRKNVMDKLAQQDKQIRKQSSEILALKSCIRQLVLVCTQLVVPGSEKEVADILTDVLNTVSVPGNTSSSDHSEVPSTSSCSTLEVASNQRGRKRSYGGHSQEYGARKKPRSEDPPDDNRTCERLI
ncbi:hypothetical protein Y032_0134g1863 [Ancylostoma ceylanicum]|uniref:Uncharacterized protein n=2 Tax=Ancylostoma ceylanicum TaxID=53326 RepID=A0A016T616_9BILA|nr:hypothetical protein Y032_0134g1863 [Ancylostoma ceylanicum]